jgi:arylsulfatase A-like enzyme
VSGAPLRVLIACALGLACARAPRAERILLITVDTLRADHVGAYGDAQAHTPTLDALAAAGTRFDAAISPTPITLPAHATLLTGLEPPRHGVRGNGVFALPAEIPTLAEHLRRAGFATAAFVGAIVLDRHYGLDRGFAHYDDRMSLRHATRGGGYAERRAEAVVDAALAWLANAPPRFFAWVHVYDPHAEYDPPPAWKDRVPGDGYRSEIAYADAQLGRLLAAVAARFPDGRTLVVVTADHGESLGEHGEPTHSFTLYDATQRVPLIVAGPGIAAGASRAEVVRLADLAPSVLALAGAEPFGDADGGDLSPLLRGRVGESRSAYVETIDGCINQGWSPLYGVRTQRWKYVRAPRPELYDLAADPREERDLAAAQPGVVAELEREIERVHAGARPLAWTQAPALDERAQLESLGYVVAAPGRDVDLAVGGVDPKDVVPRLRELDLVRALLHARDFAGALARAEAFPASGAYIDAQRAIAALYAGDAVRAERWARACAAASPGYADCWVHLGQALTAQRRDGEARAALARARAADPADADPDVALGNLHALRGELADAARAYQAAIASREGSIEAHWRLAAVKLAAGDAGGARRLLAEVPREELARSDVAALLAAGAIDGGDAAAARAWLEPALAREPENAALRALLAKARE